MDHRPKCQPIKLLKENRKKIIMALSWDKISNIAGVPNPHAADHYWSAAC